MRPPVTLEITVSPADWKHAQHVLPHQLRQWAGQVDDVQFTLNSLQDLDRHGPGGSSDAQAIRALLDDLCRDHPVAHVREVDDSPGMRAEVSRRFFAQQELPMTNHDGGPFYSYFFGWHSARHDHVLHMDSDMLFGGGSQTWLDEALTVLQSERDVLCVAPLPGPPTATGALPDRILAQHRAMGGDPVRTDVAPLAYRLHGCSTRLWLFDRSSLATRLGGTVPLEPPRARSYARARLEGNPPFDLPERTISRRMNRLGLRRIDFLGQEPGMWSLHPTMRSELFYRELEGLVRRVEDGDVPDEQRGDYNVNDSLIDWSSARAALRHQTWPRRVARRAVGALSARARHVADRA